MRSEKGMKVMAWVMLVAVVFGLGGYGVTNFGGSITSIGTVGDEEIATGDYGRALQQELETMRAQLGATFSAQQFLEAGLDAGVRERLVTTAALDNENHRLGLSVGDAALRSAIEAMPAFKGPDGKFSKETYAFVLQQNGLSVPAFESKMRTELARSLLQQAITGAVPAPKVLVDRLIAYAGERRGFSVLKIGVSDLPAQLPSPDAAGLKAYYEAHKADFTAPEAKVITYAALTPEMLAPSIQIDDKTLQDLYTQKKSQFMVPEKMTLDRLAFGTEAEAQAARAAIDSGAKTFDQLVAERGLSLKDVQMGTKTQDDLGPDAGPAVFALKAPGIAGPVQSSVGPALFRVTAISPAQTTTFDEARDELAQSLKLDKAREEIAAKVEAVNDKLASGATLEDLVKEDGLQLGTMDFTPGDSEGMAAYPEFRDAAAAAKDGDFPSLIHLKDGGIAALRLDKMRPAALIPYDKVADKVKDGWIAEETAKALTARAGEIAAAVKAGGQLNTYGAPVTEQPALRRDTIDGMPAGLVPAVFKLAKPGDVGSLQEGDGAWIYVLDSVAPPKPDDPEMAKARATYAEGTAQDLGNDSFELFASALVAGTRVNLDKTAIAAVNAQFH